MKSLSEYFLDESKEYTNEKELIDEIEAEILYENEKKDKEKLERQVFMAQLNETVQEFDIYKNKK